MRTSSTQRSRHADHEIFGVCSGLVSDASIFAVPANLAKAKPPPSHADNKPTHTKDVGEGGKAVHPASPSMPTAVNITVGGVLKLTSDMEKTKAPEKESEWLSEFTNVKATDTVIAVFTIVIGIYTVCLTKATRNLATISGKQEGSTRIIERAYVKMSHIGKRAYLAEESRYRMVRGED